MYTFRNEIDVVDRVITIYYVTVAKLLLSRDRGGWCRDRDRHLQVGKVWAGEHRIEASRLEDSSEIYVRERRTDIVNQKEKL